MALPSAGSVGNNANYPMGATPSSPRQTRVYKLYATTSGNAAASLIIGANGRITGVSWSCTGSNGATVTNAETIELTLNANTSNITTNDTPGNVIDNCQIANSVASSVSSANKNTVGLAVPVSANDRLYLNVATTLNGTAMSGRTIECCIYVN